MRERDYTRLQELLQIDSPTGFTQEVCKYIKNYLESLDYKVIVTNKGALKCSFGDPAKLAIAAHVDTLGAMVSGVKLDGTLAFSLLGGLSITGAEGAYVRVRTMSDEVFTGTLLLNDPSSHANRQRESQSRSVETMHIRLDQEVYSAADVDRLGIGIGDIICLDVNYEELENGFIKSRFLDNKAGCFVLLELAQMYAQKKVPVELYFSNYEEVGHGGSCGYSPSVEELLVIDMGVIGAACNGVEVCCSICAKDSSGPYDYEMRCRLVRLAKEKEIPHKLDIYPYYSSDGSAALAAGNDMRVGLIGPGVASSHSHERTHKKGIEATIDLCDAYIRSYFYK